MSFPINKQKYNLLVFLSLGLVSLLLYLKITHFHNETTEIDLCAGLLENLPNEILREPILNFVSNSENSDKWRYQLEYNMAPNILSQQFDSSRISLFFMAHNTDSIIRFPKNMDTLMLIPSENFTLIFGK
jgi:hypothetical protein